MNRFSQQNDIFALMKKYSVLWFYAFVLFFSFNACIDDDPKEKMPEIVYEDVIELSTDYGKMHLWLFKQTPLHRKNFFQLLDSAIIEGTEFHRIIKNFVIQGGDPLSKDSLRSNDGTGGPAWTIPAEIDSSMFKHVYGAIGAARKSDAVNPARESSGSQFYIVVNKNGQKSLDGAYTVFGHVISGMGVADSISQLPKNGSDLPNQRIPMHFRVLKYSKEEILQNFGYALPE